MDTVGDSSRSASLGRITTFTALMLASNHQEVMNGSAERGRGLAPASSSLAVGRSPGLDALDWASVLDS